ncbi:hyaluronidase-1-like [Myxocyprinus asiaticus]|uniref:hyaluronidase-1-like n=1 Tax=Myxocyprinus asiaticus TaxID=70543 RepID=UPI002222780C|nr:hyaluronidase-1-like [Myxocyprinus asiaticus]XP_051567924.1 hyaluronidase-1-like [Myxocyprinus asiaticus]XP_051567925.1 hyaluronidase-1-like [Myxocyprinus asiaticus]
MERHQHWTCLLVLFWVSLICPIFGHPPTLPYLLTHLPFFTVWNAPTERCASRFGVGLDLSVFDIVHNRDQVFMGDNITIFYSDKLGQYPFYDFHNEPVYGGIPQNASLNQHLWKAGNDLQLYIPDRDFHGLAIIDWEKWRPLWERNWDTKEMYWQGSRALVMAKHPTWNPNQIEAEAVKEFEEASRAFMEETLKLGLTERSGGLWGFYGLPCCYNYQYKKNKTYTGECPPLEMKRNDKLAWLWNVSTALYPDIYLELGLRGRDRDILLYSRHRVLEAIRVREQTTHRPPSVFPYARIAYTYSMEFLSQEDLVHTIGESVALGVGGVVLWGDGNYSQTKKACEAVRDYLDDTLGRYIVNVTEAAFLCSQTMCSSQGRCVRRNLSMATYLHLDPAVWSIVHRTKLPGPVTEGPSFVAYRRFRTVVEDTRLFSDDFKCQCFPGWGGKQCQKPVPESFT